MALRNVTIDRRSAVFVDTSALVALLVPADSLHIAAESQYLQLRLVEAKLVTTEMVLVELANWLSKIRYRQSAILIIDDLLSSYSATVVWSGRELFAVAYELYKDRADKDWSLTDCASFVVMKARGISLAFTSDGHFEQAGFGRLLEN